MTRARDFNKVAFFKNEKAEEKMEQQLLINYLKNKIDGYKKQDLKAGRELNENNFVDVNFCMERLKGYSGTTLYYKVLLRYYSVLQSTTPVLLQYHSVLQSTTPVLLCTTPVLQLTTPVLL